eukprot:scaffold129849_cov28-Tisochrysis_lutea.AAC.2
MAAPPNRQSAKRARAAPKARPNHRERGQRLKTRTVVPIPTRPQPEERTHARESGTLGQALKGPASSPVTGLGLGIGSGSRRAL